MSSPLARMYHGGVEDGGTCGPTNYAIWEHNISVWGPGRGALHCRGERGRLKGIGLMII